MLRMCRGFRAKVGASVVGPNSEEASIFLSSVRHSLECVRKNFLRREEFRVKWNSSVGRAVQSCGDFRTFSFISTYGLTDAKLSLPLEGIHRALQLLTASPTATTFDVMVSLHFLAREYCWLRVGQGKIAVQEFYSIGTKRIEEHFVETKNSDSLAALHALEFCLRIPPGNVSIDTCAIWRTVAENPLLRMTDIVWGFTLLRKQQAVVPRETLEAVVDNLANLLIKKSEKLKNTYHLRKVSFAAEKLAPSQRDLWDLLKRKYYELRCHEEKGESSQALKRVMEKL